MKRLFFALIPVITVLFYAGQTQAIPPVSQLGHQSWGAPAQRVATKIGIAKDTVFVGAFNQVRVYEVNHATPASTPAELSGLNFAVPGQVTSIAVSPMNTVILVGQNNGLRIRDYKTTTEYNTPLQLTSLPISDIVTDLEGDTAYVGIAVADSGYKIINLVNLGAITVIGGDTTMGVIVQALAYRSDGNGGDTLFVAGLSNTITVSSTMRVYDVTTPATTSELTCETHNQNYNDIVVDGDSIYVSSWDIGVRTFYRFGPPPPNGIATYGNIVSSGFRSMAMAGDTLITSSSDGIRSFNRGKILLTASPVNIYGSGPAQIVHGFGNLIYTAFNTNGFQIYSGPFTSPFKLGAGVLTGDIVYDIVGDDRNIAYIANGANGIHIMDLGTHTPLASNLSYQSGASYKKVLVQENKLYAFWDNGFNIVNVNNPSSPTLLGTYTSGLSGIRDAAFEDSCQITTINDSVLVIADNNGIKLLNVKNPQNVSQYCSITLPGGCNHVLMNEYIYAAPGYGNLALWRIRAGNNTYYSSPTFRDSTTSGHLPPAFQFAQDGRYIYYLTGDSVLRIDVRMSWVINLGSVYNAPGGQLRSIDVAGNFLHIGTNNNRIYVIDTTNTTKKDSFIVQDTPSRLKINGLNLLVAANGDGYYHLSDPYGAARVRLQNTTGMPKDTVTIPVTVLDNLSQLGALSFEMFFPFDSNRVSFINLIRGPGIPPGDSLLYTVKFRPNGGAKDTLKVVHADTGSIAGVDTLFKLQFRISNNAPVSPLIQSADILYGKIQFSEGFPVTKYRFGRISIIPRFGDANQSGTVTAVDASYILQSVIGLVAQPPMVLADVSNNGEVRAYDAALILKRMVNPAFKYPVETFYGLKQASAPKNKDVKILLTSNAVNPQSEKTTEVSANSITYEISARNVREIWSSEMVIDLGKGQKFIGYKLSSLSEGMTVQQRQEGSLLYLSMAGGTAISEDGTLLQLICEVTDAEQLKPIDIQQFILNEELIANIEGSLSGTPKTFALSQNYPNPFNPVTEIRYQLPNASKVTIAIYNVLGQQVKMLVNTSQSAGYYSIRWNGKDEAGLGVASGVYFYRIRAGGFVQTKKMMFLK